MENYGIYGQALRDYQALGVGIENRYYGDSIGPDMLTLENLKYLTFEQSLQVKDESVFLSKIKSCGSQKLPQQTVLSSFRLQDDKHEPRRFRYLCFKYHHF